MVNPTNLRADNMMETQQHLLQMEDFYKLSMQWRELIKKFLQ